ncbi:hypothetical protein [Bradyrhizobium centrosematis]|uniref:hypothetical protein n=1 Tax=Bradyrhizobium centrosematis TaxID=1300039 RepID=UPI00388D4BE4
MARIPRLHLYFMTKAENRKMKMKLTKSSEVSLEELADITSRSKSWLNKLAADGYFKSERHGTYRIGNVVAGLLKHAREEKRGAMVAPTPARTKVDEARAEQIKLRTARESGELVTFQFHCDTVALMVGGMAAMLNGLPAMLTRDLKLRSEYDRVIQGERQRLSQQWSRLADEESATSDAGTEGEGE